MPNIRFTANISPYVKREFENWIRMSPFVRRRVVEAALLNYMNLPDVEQALTNELCDTWIQSQDFLGKIGFADMP